MLEDDFSRINPISRRVPVKAVQELGRSIGVDLPDHLLRTQHERGYRQCSTWDGALHELGHLVLARSHVRSEEAFIDRSRDSDPDWVSFWHDFSNPFACPHLDVCDSGLLQVPDEWSVQSWCFEVAKAKGWLEPEEAAELLTDDHGSGLLRMFWSSQSSDPFLRYQLAGNSRVDFDSWTLKRLHRLQLRKLKRFGVDVANGLLVPTRTGRAFGPWVEIVDALDKVHHRVPRTYCPEAAPLLMALWNWRLAFGSLPADLSWSWFKQDTWLAEMRRITKAMNDKLVQHCRSEIDRIRTSETAE